MTKREKREDDLKSLEESLSIIGNISDINPSDFISNGNMLPCMADAETTDYEEMEQNILEETQEYVNKLADIYLEDIEDIRNHPAIQAKIEDDAKDVSKLVLLQNMTVKHVIDTARQIEAGENNARYLEVFAKLSKEARDQVSNTMAQKNLVGEFYRKFKKQVIEDSEGNPDIKNGSNTVSPDGSESASETVKATAADLIFSHSEINKLIEDKIAEKTDKSSKK
jgi:hypothetical protein